MSHSVTVTRTIHTTTSSAMIVNTGYASSVPGLLKLAQVIVGAICVGIVGHYFQYHYGRSYYNLYVPELFFLLIATSCLIASTCLLVSCLLSLSTAAILPKTLFEVIYHGCAFILYLAAGITLLVQVSGKNVPYYEAYLAASVLVLLSVLTILILSASLNMILDVIRRNSGYNIYERGYGSKIFAAILGLVNAALYLFSLVFAVRTYRLT